MTNSDYKSKLFQCIAGRLYWSMSGAWKTIELPFPNSDVKHAVFYKAVSALEVEVYNLPLAGDTDMITLLTEVFTLFGDVDEVQVAKDKAIVKFETAHGCDRAKEGRAKHSRAVPYAFKGEYGINKFVAKFNELHPPLETLERVSNEQIELFEQREAEIRERSGGRKVIRLTEAEKRKYVLEYQQKVQKMKSSDFYNFQQKDRPNLITEMLTDDGPAPRHMKKAPKVRKPNLVGQRRVPKMENPV